MAGRLTLDEITGDLQTSIIGGITGAVAGRVSEQIADQILKVTSIQGESIGELGLILAIRSLVSSVTFVGLAHLMPETTDNVYFSFVYFTADTALTTAAINFADMVQILAMKWALQNKGSL